MAEILHKDNDSEQFFKKLSLLSQQLQSLTQVDNFSELISQIEICLDEITPFLYYRFYQMDKDEQKLTCLGEICPEELFIDIELYKWSLFNHMTSFIPITISFDKSIKGNILIPIIGKKPIGVISLWVDYSTEGFNVFVSLALNLLSQQISSAISLLDLKKQNQLQKKFTESIVANIPFGLIAIMNDGTIESFNSNAEILFNVNRGEATKKSFMAVLPQKISSVIHSLNLEAAKYYGASEAEVEYELKGNIIYLSISSSIILNEENEKIGFVITCRDLALSREVSKLRELDAMKNEFVSLVSHELRTPLSVIISYAELLLTPDIDTSKEETEEYLTLMMQEGRRLSRLVNDILDLSKTESGKMDYIFANHQINDLAKQCVLSSEPLAEKKNITLQSELFEPLPEASCDYDRLVQVFLNVLSNAIKFTPDNGLITVFTRKIDKKSKKYIQIEVKDSGCGIAEKDFDKVFNKFEQVENVDSHGTGTGLGMPISKSIVEQGHGGFMYIKSQLNVGTSVFFEIPI